MNDRHLTNPGTTPGRRELTSDRRRARRSLRLRIGAAAVAGTLAVGIAGATAQNDDLRAGLAGLSTPLIGPAASDNPADPAAEPAPESQDAAAAEQEAREQQEQDAAAAEEAAAEDAGAEEAAEAAAEDEVQASEEAAAAEEQAAAEAQAAEQAAQDEAAAQAAEEAAEEAAAEAEAAEQAAAEAPPAVVDDPAAAKAYAASALAARGWAATEMTCLDTLWEKESNWMTSATNASSGAYGIVQSLPAEKMAAAGPDYLTNYKTQINWGLDYIASRYGTPCSALNFHYANNWY